MPKTVLYAPAAGGKTAYAIKIAHERAASLQAEVRVCVPSRLQAHAWRRRLAAAGGAVGVHLFTFDQLAAACLNEAGETYTQLREPVQYRLLRTIIRRLPLQHYAPLTAKPGFVQVTGGIIRELKQRLIYPVDFAQAVGGMGNAPRLQELAAIYDAYQQHLRKEKWADPPGLHWLAIESLRDRAPDACRDWPLLIVDGFDDFNLSQLALLQLLADRVGQFMVTVPRATAVDYPRYQRTYQQIEAQLGSNGAPLPQPQSQSHNLINHVVTHIFAHTPPDPLPAEGIISMREAPDRPAEVRTALRWLKQRLLQDHNGQAQVALLAREIRPYRSTIEQIAAEFGFTVRLVDGLPLAQSPVIAALLDLLRLFLPVAANGDPSLPRRQVVAAWRSPYFRWQNEYWTITPADADALDLLAREQRVIRGLAQWQAAFAAGLAVKGERPQDEEEGQQQPLPAPTVAQLQDKFDYFRKIAQPPAQTSLRDFVAWLETLIGPEKDSARDAASDHDGLHIHTQVAGNPATRPADLAALNTLKEILRGLVWAEEAVGSGGRIDFVSFFNELNGAILATRFDLPPSAVAAQILVANVTQVRGLSFPAVAIMGLSEGDFPQTISEDPFLRDDDRQRLRQASELPLEPSTRSAEREFFYEALSRARQKLLLTRPVLAENGAEWVASPFWEAVLRLVDVPVEQIPSEATLPPSETASWAEWWETMASYVDGSALAQRQDSENWQHIEVGAGIWQARQEAQCSPWEGDLRAVAPQLALQHGPQQIWSASRLETVRKCGFLFYLQYVLGLAPRPEPVEGLDARQLGSLYHHILEKVTQASELDRTDETAVVEAVNVIATPILEAAPQKLGFRATPWWQQTRQEISENVVRTILALGEGAYTFLAAERSFGIYDDPLIIVAGADQLRLRGFIDRVDRDEEGRLRIIDYKLGGPSGFTTRAFATGEKLQLPLYAKAAEETLNLGTVADGFYWHVQHVERSGFTLAKADGGIAGAIETAVGHAWAAVHQVRAGQFTPTPPRDGCPSYCPAAGFCWQYAPRQW